MVCAVVLSSAVLFGASEINVQAADGGVVSTSSNSLSTEKDKDTPIDSESYDGFTPTWAIYAINGDKNNLQLKLGSPDETETIADTTGWGNLDWMNASKGYFDKITSEVIVGKIKTSYTQQYLFSAMPNLKTITGLNLLDTSGTSDFSNMFNGDSKLESLDISDWDMSAATKTSDMFKNTRLSSLTLGPKSVISNSTLGPTDSFIYILNGNTHTANGWKDASDTSTTPKVLTSEDLMSMYSSSNSDRTQTTWVPNRVPESVKYYIQYVDNSTGVALPVKSSQTYDGVTDDKPVDLSTITNGKLTLGQIGQLQSGYSADSIENKTGVIDDDGNGGYAIKAKVKKLDPVNISVSQTVGSDKSTDQSFKIPVNDTSYKYADITNPSNSTIDLNKSTIKIGDGKAESFADYSATSKDLNSILSTAIKSQFNKSGVFGDDTAGTTPITVNAVYTKNSTSGGSSSGNHTDSGDNNNTEDKGGTTTEVKQTVSTTTKDVRLYDKNGKLITNRALAENSVWFSDQEYTLDGILYYRVANDEYVKASDVYIYTAEDHIVDTKGKSIVYLVDSNGHKVTDRALSPNTEWYTDRYTIINGQKYYRVATNEFVSAADVSLL